jgi:hypothetical protein
MITVFYTFGFILVWFEISNLKNINDYLKWKELLIDGRETDNPLLGLMFVSYVTWVFIGLLSSQWIVFLLLVIVNFIPKGLSKPLHIADSITSIILLLFIIVNKFHLHIDVFGLIFK